MYDLEKKPKISFSIAYKICTSEGKSSIVFVPNLFISLHAKEYIHKKLKVETKLRINYTKLLNIRYRVELSIPSPIIPEFATIISSYIEYLLIKYFLANTPRIIILICGQCTIERKGVAPKLSIHPRGIVLEIKELEECVPQNCSSWFPVPPATTLPRSPGIFPVYLELVCRSCAHVQVVSV